MLHVASVYTPCCMLLRVLAQSLKPVKLFSQQLPTFLLFRDRRSVAQQCWIRLHSSSNIVGAAYARYAWFTKTYGLYPSHDTLQVPTLLGGVASVCTPLPTCTQQLPTLLAEQCWELLRPFARSLSSFTSTKCGYDINFLNVIENMLNIAKNVWIFKKETTTFEFSSLTFYGPFSIQYCLKFFLILPASVS